MVKNWYKRSTQNFRFTAKFPKIITHDKRLKDVDTELGRFFEAMRPLVDKTLALLIQLPPSLHIFEGLERTQIRGRGKTQLVVSRFTTDFLYLRFIGDRSIKEKDFGRIQIEGT